MHQARLLREPGAWNHVAETGGRLQHRLDHRSKVVVIRLRNCAIDDAGPLSGNESPMVKGTTPLRITKGRSRSAFAQRGYLCTVIQSDQAHVRPYCGEDQQVIVHTYRRISSLPVST